MLAIMDGMKLTMVRALTKHRHDVVAAAVAVDNIHPSCSQQQHLNNANNQKANNVNNNDKSICVPSTEQFCPKFGAVAEMHHHNHF